MTFGEPSGKQTQQQDSRKRKQISEDAEVAQVTISTLQTDEFEIPGTEPQKAVYYTYPTPTLQAAVHLPSAYAFDSHGDIDSIPWDQNVSEASTALSVPKEQEERLAMVVQEAVGEAPHAGWTPEDFLNATSEHVLPNGQSCTLFPLPDWADQLRRPPTLYPNPKFSWGSGHQEAFYMHMWDKQCLSALHPVFRQFGIMENIAPIVQKAILSVSACHLSRRLPQRKTLTVTDIPGLAYRPEIQHQVASQEFYQSATQQLRLWTGHRNKSELNSMLAAMILFCSLESSMGNFAGFNIHSNGVRTLLRMRDEPRGPHDTTQLELQDAWKQTHILNWWRRFHFSPPTFQNTPFPQLDEVSDPRERDALSWPLYHRVDIMTSLCEALSVVSRTTSRGWERETNVDLTDVADLDHELDILDVKISTWLKAFQSSQKVYPDVYQGRPGSAPEEIPDLWPLKFPSHDEAMNFAYWATARVMYCAAERTIDRITGTTRYRRVQKVIEGWISIVLRVAMAIDWDNCVRYNTHTIGMSGLLLACAIRSEKLDVGLWVENWLEERRSTAGLEEGSFPVLQILQILRIVNRERKAGFDVVSIFSTKDDGGGKGKFQSYHSQVLETVEVCVRCRETGKESRKIVPV